MRIRHLHIENFRGIKSLDWLIPPDKKFVCLIGPGDSGKSSILDALYWTLGERWSLSITDTDYFGGDFENSITIRVVLSDLPTEIRSHWQLGLNLSGINQTGEMAHDPIDGFEPCVVVQLTIDKEMEPTWSLYRPDGTEPWETISSGTRRLFSIFKIDDRVDNHLRWTRTSALTKLSDSNRNMSETLANALRAAQDAVSEVIPSSMNTLAADIGTQLGKIGSGTFPNLKPGLDISGSASSGILALFDGDIPLTNFGLGTRRLAAIATQEMAAAGKSVILVDEIEYGLEPHRLVHLLKHLRSEARHEQVFVTTHSAIAIEQLDSADLAVIALVDGAMSAQFVPHDLDFAQATLRGSPSAFLAKKIIVTEGKTEIGLLIGLIESWDALASENGTATSSALGVAIADGKGSNAPSRAIVLSKLGYDVSLFVDNDNRTMDSEITEANSHSVMVFRWDEGKCTESQLIETLDAQNLTDLLRLACNTRGDFATVKSDLLNFSLEGPRIPDLQVGNWLIDANFTIHSARTLISNAARKSKWFKDIGYGILLSQFVLERYEQLSVEPFGVELNRLREYLYATDTRPPVQRNNVSGENF